ncbi:MAG: TonB-dependent receptor [Cyclobacteriaceae bacterium]|nr:TonB-dependent receptor [Cyclobacteriaceae bacterium]
MQLIEKQSSISFAFKPDQIPLKAKVTHKGTGKPLKQVIESITAQYHLIFELVEKQIVLLPNPALKPFLFNISGTVADKSTGESLIGATLQVDNLAYGTITNGYGYYSLALPYGKHKVEVSYLGYHIMDDSIDLVDNINLSFALNQSNEQLKEVVVKGYNTPKSQQIQTGKITIAPSSVKELPAILGESDVIKSLERIPGIKLQSEGSTFFYVRGGNKDQNLILIDDAPIYNPSHLLGLFSTIVPGATNSIDVYKSDFPISKGGRLSSVIDIKLKEGNKNRLSGWGNIGLVSTQLGIEGPIKKGKHSFLITSRVSRIKWFFKQEFPSIEKFNFYDLTGKLNFKLNNKNKFYFSFYTGADKFLDKNAGLEWSNINGSIRWNKLINDQTFMNTTVFVSNYEYLFHYNRNQQVSWRSRIGELGFKTDFTHFIDNKQEINWGVALTARTINPGNLIGLDSLPEELIVSVKNNLESAIYGAYQVKPFKQWGFKFGLRATTWSSVGESFEFVFDENKLPTDTLTYKPGKAYKTVLGLEPRISASYFINTNSSVKLSYDRTLQNLHLITNSISPFTSFEVWLPSGPNIRAQVANQIALGYYHFLPNLGVSLEAETYYKILTNQIDYAAHASTLLNPLIETELVFGTTKTYGIELMAKKEVGKLRGILGYTLSKATSQFAEINQGNSFIANTDRPHYASLSLSYNLTSKVSINSNFIYSSGIPFSSPASFYLFDGNETPVYTEKNNSRIPAYHRLDASVKFILNKNITQKFRHSITLSVYNVYGRKNAIFINFNKSNNQQQGIQVPTNLIDATRITSRMYVYGFVPAISYQFKF